MAAERSEKKTKAADARGSGRPDMFDIGWTEMMVIAAVAIIVVGPKDLPRMLRTFGKTMGQVRRTANDFKRQFNDALREAEREAGLEETRRAAADGQAVEPREQTSKKDRRQA